MSGDSSRKPSGSSTHSGAQSPTSSSGNVSRPLLSLEAIYNDHRHPKAQSQWKLAPPNTTAAMFGVGSAGGLKGLHSGWQVGATRPTIRLSAARNVIYLRRLGLGIDRLPFVKAQRVCFLSVNELSASSADLIVAVWVRLGLRPDRLVGLGTMLPPPAHRRSLYIWSVVLFVKFFNSPHCVIAGTAFLLGLARSSATTVSERCFPWP